MDRNLIIPLAGMLMIITISLGMPLVRALTKRWEREGLAPREPSDVSQRLERIENAIETMAVEVERISEGQRFTTKLLADRADGAGSTAAGTDRLAGERR
jgi:hypothetical protein